MRYCFHCSRVTLGEPRFCNFCGRTYDSKLCHRLHENPREAAVCAECGSRDLSVPQPKLRFWFRPILFLLSVLPGFFLLFLTVAFFLVYAYALFSRPDLQLRCMLLSLVLGVLWLVYIKLPGPVRRAIRKEIRRSIK
jgi:RNA polymerase subunit RPABC4/transcription elongation factor Spt4